MLREYRARALGLPDLLNFAALVDEGVVLNKDGAFLAGWWYSGPGHGGREPRGAGDPLLAGERARWSGSATAGCCRPTRSAGQPAATPPPGAFPDPTTALIDEERRRQYVAGAAPTRASTRSRSPTCLRATCRRGSADGSSRARGRIAPATRRCCASSSATSWSSRTRSATGSPSSRMASEDLLSFLHLCVTGISQPRSGAGGVPMYLDALLGSQDLFGGFQPRVGSDHVRPIAVAGFPAESFPGMLDFLNRLPVEYRWSNRFIPLDPNTAEARLKLLRRNWFQKRQGLSGHDQAGAEPGGAHLRQPRRRGDGRGRRRRRRGGCLGDGPLRLLHERHPAARRGRRGARRRRPDRSAEASSTTASPRASRT